jgi:FkbM family methyltransferase
MLMRIPRKLAAAAGFELVRRDAGALRRLQRNGIRPATVIDVGAALGDWSRECAGVFPDASYLMVEPLEEFAPALESTASSIASAAFVQAAVAEHEGERTFNVHEDMVGSSLLREREGEHVDGRPRTVKVTTVDALVQEHDLQPPFLLKVDVQGAEAVVLAGAVEALRLADAVLLETSFFGFFVGGIPFESLVAQMADAGFVVYDIENLARRPLDDALSQADVTFVRADSVTRSKHVYARPEQRAAQTAEFARAIRRRIERARRR